MATKTLKQIIDAAGGQTALAGLISQKLRGRLIRQSHVGNWLKSRNADQMPPAEYVPALVSIAHDLGLSIYGRDLRPDIYPDGWQDAA